MIEHKIEAEAVDCWPEPKWSNYQDACVQRHSDFETVYELAEIQATDALMIIQHGQVVAAYGDLTRKFLCHSIRKSFLSALIGLEVERGTIDPSLTLDALGIDDREGLSIREKSATIYDLLTARSGIYHPAGYETPWMRSIKEPRHSHAPGTFWCYNNWDFNALGTIYTNLSGLSVHAGFEKCVARPIAMDDFRFDAEMQDGWLAEDPCSIHPAYAFRMSTRDLARFGLLFLRQGRWADRQVIPHLWTRMSVLPHSEAGDRGGYGFMWWVARQGVAFPGTILPEGSFSAIGAGGHYCLVVPNLDLVVVHRVDTDIPLRQVDRFQFGTLVERILRACRNAPQLKFENQPCRA
ncbi:serine hydrolase domain-containing protein [Microvirga puerhi]|uniref:Beta-lactamase family protein n=1 Tax=Microvirga puerhi TaxID=2876078 RepID=A0ABS7VT27_9HYPH|nr:serine hydrolase domain-containing protein [Microvirga puerhi]MBZ6078709.1 beta-lactamase family protein [Microvirga puerhi]